MDGSIWRIARRPQSILLVAIVLGVALRIGALTLYSPVVLSYYGGDSLRYLRFESSGVVDLFGDAAMPAGYPAFLAALRAFWDWLPFTILVQHCLGVATALLLYCAVVRAGGSRWAALLPAAVVLLSGDQIFLEHGLLTEALWMPVLALGMYLAIRSLAAPGPSWWLAGAGIVLAVSAFVRSVSLMVPLLVSIWAVAALPGDALGRLRNGVAVLLPAALVVGAYFVVATQVAGGYSGLVENRGLSLYGRVGQFADCSRFTPPPSTEPLCVSTSPAERSGPFFWTYGADSPLRTRVRFDGFSSEDQELLAEFGRRAILHQPLDYLQAVAFDSARFFGLHLGARRPDSGTDAESMSFASTIPHAQDVSQEELAARLSEKYSGVGSGAPGEQARGLLGGYQSAIRVGGLGLAVLLLLNAVGVALGSGRTRAGAALFLVVGSTLLLLPPALSAYDVRYAVQPINLFAAGAALGVGAFAARVRRRSAIEATDRQAAAPG